MKKYICFIFCCILLFVSCSNKNSEKPIQDSTIYESVNQIEPEDFQETENPVIPEITSFSTMILAEGDMVLQQDYYPMDEENLLEFQNADVFSMAQTSRLSTQRRIFVPLCHCRRKES